MTVIAKSAKAIFHQEIRDMDKIVRQANISYPRISPYRAADRAAELPVEQRHWDCINHAGEIVDSIRAKTQFFPFLDIIFNSTKAMQKTKLGDCAESSGLTMCALLANGHTDGKVARLGFEAIATDLTTGKEVGRKLIDTTHEFIVRHLSKTADSAKPETYGKNLIVMDAWTGFCGNTQEAFKHYFDTFWHGIREFVQPEHNVKITYKPKFTFLNLGAEPDSKIAEVFREKFPELIIPQKPKV